MKYVSGRLWLFCLCVGLLAMSGIAGAAEVSLKAVKVIHPDTTETLYDPPVSSLTASAGDLIECEIYGSNWSPNGTVSEKLKSYQVQIDGSLFGTGLPVMPAYWDNFVADALCTDAGDCLPGQICWISETGQGFCAGPDHHPEDGCYADSMRSDYIFAPTGTPPPEFKGTDLMTPNIRFSSTLISPILAPLYNPPPKYIATFTLELLPEACGPITVGLAGGGKTFFVRNDNQILNPSLTPLQINAGVCACQLVDADPPNCAVDARQPSKPDGTEPKGWNSITFTVDDCDPCTLGLSKFEIREVPFNIRPIQLSSKSCNSAANTVTLTFSRLITESTWTCVKYLDTGAEFCMGHQPGDVNSDRKSAPSDILYVIDCLNNVTPFPCEIYQCDVDRSGVCGPPDILRVIDLLNGAQDYDPYLNQQIPACPTAP